MIEDMRAVLAALQSGPMTGEELAMAIAWTDWPCYLVSVLIQLAGAGALSHTRVREISTGRLADVWSLA